MTAIMRDLLVVLPGILGSTLAKNGKLVWAPSAGALLRAITTFGRNIKELELPSGIGDENPNDGVAPVELMPDIHMLPGVWSASIGYDGLLSWLRSRFHLVEAPQDDPDRAGNFFPIPYDWRLSNRYNGRRLKSIVEPALEKWRSHAGGFEDARIVFVCHSMGGLVARWYIEREGGAEVTRKLITLGTPHRGALDALVQLVNGAHVGLGRLAIDLTEFARSLPSLYQLLPEYACIETPDALAKTTETAVPNLVAGSSRNNSRSWVVVMRTISSGAMSETVPVTGTSACTSPRVVTGTNVRVPTGRPMRLAGGGMTLAPCVRRQSWARDRLDGLDGFPGTGL